MMIIISSVRGLEGGGSSFQPSWNERLLTDGAHYNPQHRQHCFQTRETECGQENEQEGATREPRVKIPI